MKSIDFEFVELTKNRGWRGLAELKCLDKEYKELHSMIFSFSQEMWDDMLKGTIVTQDKDGYFVITFNNTDELPKPHQQRSVLIKHFRGNVLAIDYYSKTSWADDVKNFDHRLALAHFIRNKNNHTKSDWNCIGIRVMPNI